MLLSLSLVANEVMEGGPEAAEIRLVSLAGGGGVGVSLVLKARRRLRGVAFGAWALTQQARHGGRKLRLPGDRAYICHVYL